MKIPQGYVLITPAKNEYRYIGRCIDSIARQTIHPLCWVIISDASDDGTDDIIMHYTKTLPFIHYIRKENSESYSFHSKAKAFSMGYAIVQRIPYKYIGNLDADVTLQNTYYSQVMELMEQNKRLGVAGGVIMERTKDQYQYVLSNKIHVPGAVQFYRRECFEQIGGYPRVSVYGEDSLAILTARMNGWETHSFKHIPVFHHKPGGSGTGKSVLQIRYKEGLTDYYIGTHPLFALGKCLRRIGECPILGGAFVRLCGYCYGFFKKLKPDASPQLMAYIHSEQKKRLQLFLFSMFKM